MFCIQAQICWFVVSFSTDWLHFCGHQYQRSLVGMCLRKVGLQSRENAEVSHSFGFWIKKQSETQGFRMKQNFGWISRCRTEHVRITETCLYTADYVMDSVDYLHRHFGVI